MKIDLGDLNAFVTVARAGGFRDGARTGGVSASGLSEAVRRLETGLGVRLLNRTTRSIAPTEAGKGLLDRLGPALTEVEAALNGRRLDERLIASVAKVARESIDPPTDIHAPGNYRRALVATLLGRGLKKSAAGSI